ncbi:MAG: (Fe-S)-binding protein [Acidobacteria bacterium]|nr:(Fe-S)-binding protein [Acidobacteriota bacterium]
MTGSGMEVTREILGNVPSFMRVAFYGVTFAACGVAAVQFLRRLSRYRRARPETRQAEHRSFTAGLGSVVRYLTFHEQLLRDRYAGIAHLSMFYGFVILFVGTCLVFLEHSTPLHFFHGTFYLIASLVIDLGGVAFITGLVMFLARRMVGREKRILNAAWVSSLAWLLLVIGLSGFLLEGLRIAQDLPDFERWSMVGYAIARGFRALGVRGSAALLPHRVLWVTHALFCAAFFALLPWKFFGHMAYGAVSWATRSGKALGKLRLPALEHEAPGVATTGDLSWRDLVHTDACTTCGRCNEVCPATAAAKPLRPREVILGLRAALDREAIAAGNDRGAQGCAAGVSILAHVPDEALWSCTTCTACNEVCPVGIEIYDKIVDGRRGRVETGTVPAAAEKVFESTASEFNPYGKAAIDRMAWASGLEVPVAREDEPIDLLYWVGCAGSFDPDGQAVSRAMIRILNRLGVRYHVLGPRECCTGDPARRMGEEGLFREAARTNIDRFRRHAVKRVLTHCPHCFNTFLNEYPELGASFEVEHHSQFLARMIRDGKLSLPSSGSEKIVFHDPCYLGRGNGETRAPREVLRALQQTNLLEMPRHGASSFCCGAGGGALWLDVPGKTRVESLRAAEAAETGATIVATGCPFCKTMLESGKALLPDGGGDLKVKDLAELVVESQGW